MRKLFTMFFVLGASIAFAQFGHPRAVENHNYTKHFLFNPHEHTSMVRGESACDSFDLMDYCTFNEVVALQQGQVGSAYYGFNTASNPLYVQGLTHQITDASGNDGAYSYAAMAFDTLAFQDYPNQQLYHYPLASSTITLEGIQFFYAYDADTIAADGKIANDSLVFSVYAVNAGVVGSTPVTTVVMSGDSLSQFYTGATSVGVGSVPASFQLAQGQGFFIRVDYINQDTSTHFSLAFTFLDSCGLVTYQGGQYLLADASPVYNGTSYLGNQGLSFMGVIFPGTGTGAATVSDWNNFYGIQSGVPTVCSLVPNQNWAILPIIDVCQDYTAQIQASPLSACPGATINLTGSVVGSPNTTTVVTPNTLTSGGAAITNTLHYGDANNNNLSYTWSSSAGAGALSSTNSSAPTLTMPQGGNVTVTMSVSDGVADTSASIVITSNPITLSITNSPQPIQLACGGNVTIHTSVSGSTTGHYYTWTGLNLDTAGAGVANLKVSYPGTYYVSVTNAAGCSFNDSVMVQSAGVSNSASFTPTNPICQNRQTTFNNTSTNQAGWTASWTFGDPAQGTATALSPTYTYAVPGSFQVQLIMDSAGCLFQSPKVNVIVYSSSSNTCIAAIEDITFDNSISLMPNPSNGNVNIVINGIQSNLTIRVYNILGSEVHNFTATELPASFNKSFDFSNLANGTYLVKIQSGDQTAVKRLVISK